LFFSIGVYYTLISEDYLQANITVGRE